MRARKRFGQHFLVDESVLDAIIRHINPRREDRMLEIGPGRGALTQLLCGELQQLHGIELDRDLIAGLTRRYDNLVLTEGDVLAVDLPAYLAAGDWRLVGNLPYDLSSPLLLALAPLGELIVDMHFMLQRELAARLAAQPGSKAWGRLSVVMQRYWHVDALFDVNPDAFEPPPKVMSQVVRMNPRRDVAEVHDEGLFKAVVAAAFGQRRKTLHNSLRDYSLDFAEFDLRANQRAEEVSVAQFVAMANSIAVRSE